MKRHLPFSGPAVIALAAVAALAAAPRARAEPQRASGVEPVEAIRAAAVAFVRSQLSRDATLAEVSANALDGRLRLARCASRLEAEPTGGAGALARLTVAVSCPGPVHWRIYVPVTVVRRQSVLVLRHAVARESELTADDVTVEMRRTTGFAQAYLSSPTELRGRTVLRTLAAGTTLTADMLTADVIIHRGQEVTLIARTGGIEVRAPGRALEDAPAGARIKVANASSNKVVEGLAETADTVIVAGN